MAQNGSSFLSSTVLPVFALNKNGILKATIIYSFRIIPYRGSWLEGAFDTNDLIYIYIDRKKRRRKILATTFIRTLGYSTDADIIEEFFSTRQSQNQI